MGLEHDDTTLTADAIRAVTTAPHFGSGGARVLASVLLHCYNPDRYRLDISDLCMLDRELVAMAWGVMRLRVAGVEPHQVIPGFDQVIEIYGEQQL